MDRHQLDGVSLQREARQEFEARQHIANLRRRGIFNGSRAIERLVDQRGPDQAMHLANFGRPR